AREARAARAQRTRLERTQPGLGDGRCLARRSLGHLRLRAPDLTAAGRAGAGRSRLRGRLRADAAYVVLGLVADDGQVHAPALAAGGSRGFGSLGAAPADLRLQNRGIL